MQSCGTAADGNMSAAVPLRFTPESDTVAMRPFRIISSLQDRAIRQWALASDLLCGMMPNQTLHLRRMVFGAKITALPSRDGRPVSLTRSRSLPSEIRGSIPSQDESNLLRPTSGRSRGALRCPSPTRSDFLGQLIRSVHRLG